MLLTALDFISVKLLMGFVSLRGTYFWLDCQLMLNGWDFSVL